MTKTLILSPQCSCLPFLWALWQKENISVFLQLVFYQLLCYNLFLFMYRNSCVLCLHKMLHANVCTNKMENNFSRCDSLGFGAISAEGDGAAHVVPCKKLHVNSSSWLHVGLCLWPRLRHSVPLRINLFEKENTFGKVFSFWCTICFGRGRAEGEVTMPSPR